MKIAFESSRTEGSKWGFLPLPEPVHIDSDKARGLLNLGVQTTSIYQKTSSILTEVAQYGEPQWLYKLMFSSFSERYLGQFDVERSRDFAIELMKKSSGKPPPVFRLDVLGNMKVCEFQASGSAWGVLAALEDFLGEGHHSWSVKNLFRERLLSKAGVWWSHIPQYRRQFSFLVNYLNSHGLNIRLITDEFFDPRQLVGSVFLRTKHFTHALGHSTGRRILEHWIQDQLEVDPAPHLVDGSKVAWLLLWHPDTRALFSDEERAVSLPTVLIEDLEQIITLDGAGSNGEDLSFRLVDLMDTGLKPGLSRLIVKYGGDRPGDFTCGRAVFALHKMVVKERRQLINRALSEWKSESQPWFIQPFSFQKTKIRDLSPQLSVDLAQFWQRELVPMSHLHELFRQEAITNADLYTLFRPSYLVKDNGDVRMGPCGLLLRRKWKVHGTSDGIQALCLPESTFKP